jgi:hypothetical protein
MAMATINKIEDGEGDGERGTPTGDGSTDHTLEDYRDMLVLNDAFETYIKKQYSSICAPISSTDNTTKPIGGR